MTNTTNGATMYFARYGETPRHRSAAAWEPLATLAEIQAACKARGTNADLQDVVGFGAGQVHWNGRHVGPSRLVLGR